MNLSFVFFRAASIGFAMHMLAAMLPHRPLLGTTALKTVLAIAPTLILRPVVFGAVLAFWFKTSQQLAQEFRPTLKTAFATAALIAICLFFVNSTVAKQFVYFAF